MNMNAFNGCLITAWLMITIGTACVNFAAGGIVGGAVLLILTLLVGARFGVYEQDKNSKPGGDQ